MATARAAHQGLSGAPPRDILPTRAGAVESGGTCVEAAVHERCIAKSGMTRVDCPLVRDIAARESAYVDMAVWLRELGLEHYLQAFADNAVSGDVLADLTDGDLEKVGVRLGDR